MEQIVLLEVDDDLASVRGKLSSLRPGQAAIFVSGHNPLFRGPIAFKVIRRQAADFGLKLSVISESPTVRDWARKQGIRSFGSIQAYRRSLAKKEGSLSPSLIFSALSKISGLTAFILLLISVAIIGVALVFLVIPHATVYLYPVSEKISERLEITADPNAKSINYEKRIVPSRISYVRATATEQIQSSGKKSGENAKAEGQITLTNRTNKELIVPSGTILSTPKGIKFTTLEEAILPAGTQGTDKVGIMAIDPGKEGNVERGQITKVEGPLEMQVTAFNEQPTVGGGGGEVNTVTEEDKAKLRQSVYSKLEQEVNQKLEAERLKSEIIAKDSIKIVILKEIYDRDVGQQSKTLSLDMEVRASATYLNLSDVENVTRSWTPRLQPGYYLRPESITYSEPKVIDASGSTALLLVELQGIVTSRINTDRIADSVRWKTAEEAKDYLSKALVLGKEPEVILEPSWASRALRVEVVILTTENTTQKQ